MTGGDKNVSLPALPCAGTGPIIRSTAMASGAGASDGERRMRPGKESAFAGGSSVASPAPPTNSLKGREAEAVGGEMKRKTAVFNPSSGRWSCTQCDTTFDREKGVHGHMKVHKRPPKQQAEDGKKKRKDAMSFASGVSMSCSLSGTQFKSHQARCGHMHVHNNQPQWQVQQVHEEQDKVLASILLKLAQGTLNETEDREKKGDSSAVAEGSPSSAAAAAVAQRKKIHLELDLNEAPVDAAVVAQRKKIHMKLDLNEAPVDDGNGDEEGA